MSRSVRYLLNALLLALIGGHAVYWFATGRAEFAPSMSVWLKAAQAVVGFGGAIWFYSRSRGAANRGS
jgi:hypothetical protein